MTLFQRGSGCRSSRLQRNAKRQGKVSCVTHRIHVWYIYLFYLHLPNVGKYTIHGYTWILWVTKKMAMSNGSSLPNPLKQGIVGCTPVKNPYVTWVIYVFFFIPKNAISLNTQLNTTPGWWLNQPIWKIWAKLDSSSPIFGVKFQKKY